MHGNGIFSWGDGRKYIGEYENDKKNGYGEFYWPDGKVFKGKWRNGKQVIFLWGFLSRFIGGIWYSTIEGR